MRTRLIRILDLFCGEGAAAMGYYQAASNVQPGTNVVVQIVGVDIRPMPRYPFTFVQEDALSLDYEFLSKFDFIHASPPCKPYTKLYRFSRKDLDKTVLPRTITTLEASGLPYVLENVPQAPLRADVQLDGSMFDIPVKKRRIFQTNLRIERYPRPTTYSESMEVVVVAGNSSTLEAASKAMGINWMSKEGIREAIPPIYTEWIGSQVLRLEAGKLAE